MPQREKEQERNKRSKSHAAHKAATFPSFTGSPPPPDPYHVEYTQSHNVSGPIRSSFGSELELALPPTPGSQLASILLASELETWRLPQFEDTDRSTHLPTCVETLCSSAPALDCICGDKSPFHNGYAAMAGYETSCMYCSRHRFEDLSCSDETAKAASVRARGCEQPLFGAD
jgi:hypothetical protein